MLKIYGVPISVHTRKAIVAAIAKQLPHEVVPVAPVAPASLPPDWDELSPTGKIPVLAHDGFVLADSAAICAYLEHLQPQPPLYPGEARAHALAISLEQYAGQLFRDVVHPLFHETVVHPKLRGIPTDVARVDAVLTHALPPMFAYLDGAAARGWLAGDAMSIADIHVVSNLLTYQYLGFDLQRTRYPRLAALHDRTVRHPAVQEALRREQPSVEAMGLRGDVLRGMLA
ncbi:MAG: glutathione S-transferase family protein [Pseudomonadota bacterium]